MQVMQRVFTMMWTAIVDTWSAFGGWLAQLERQLPALVGRIDDGLLWFAGLGALLVVALLMRLFRPRRPRAVNRPDVQIARGELIPGEPDADGRQHFSLILVVDNHNPFSVRLTRIAFRSEYVIAPETVPIRSVIGPNSSTALRATMTDLEGDEGQLEVYLYAGPTRHHSYRLRAQVEWEPWSNRYRLDPQAQWLEATGRRSADAEPSADRQVPLLGARDARRVEGAEVGHPQGLEFPRKF